jgi:hypothetical protein
VELVGLPHQAGVVLAQRKQLRLRQRKLVRQLLFALVQLLVYLSPPTHAPTLSGVVVSRQ